MPVESWEARGTPVSKLTKGTVARLASYTVAPNVLISTPTKRSTPPVQKLINWLITKNKTLKDSKGNIVNLNDIKKVKRIAFAIQKSLNVNGIQRTGFLTNLVKEQFNELSRIDVPVVQDIIEDLDNILKRNGYKKTGDKFSISIKRI